MDRALSFLFGTDGVRGRANDLLTPELTLALARAAAAELLPNGGRVIVGRDTRTSGPMLEAALASGFAAAGADVYLAGIIPTPAISFLIKDERAHLGAMISASHNPPDDNGIKFFNRAGMKLAVEEERAIEAGLEAEHRTRGPAGTIAPLEAAGTRYAAFLAGTIDADEVDLSGQTIAVDCAFGATGRIAPHVLRHLGANVVELHSSPDGRKINAECGSTHLGAIRAAVAEHNADLGIAFDGDGDRVLLIAKDGTTIDGDRMMGIAALHMQKQGILNPPVIVATILSNLGLEHVLADHGIRMIRTPVGDRHVSRAMVAHAARIGGEQSGHIILSDHSPTGDGILTAVKLLEFAHKEGCDLTTLAERIPLYPQIHRTLHCPSPDEAMQSPAIQRAIEKAREEIGDRGRVVVRASGTQPMVRIMVEADDADLCERISAPLEAQIAGLLQQI